MNVKNYSESAYSELLPNYFQSALDDRASDEGLKLWKTDSTSIAMEMDN